MQRALSLAAAYSARGKAFGMFAGPAAPAGATRMVPLNLDWRFAKGAASAASGFTRVDLPHSAAKLSWQDWSPAQWESLWTYRRTFDVPASALRGRAFLRFDGVMQQASPTLNGARLEDYSGGFLPFDREITTHLRAHNELTVELDARWIDVPPGGSPKGESTVDYYIPGGIPRGVSLILRPQTFIADVFAKPVHVLTPDRAVIVECTIDTHHAPSSLRIEVELLDGPTVLAREHATANTASGGLAKAHLTLSHLGNIALWSPRSPKLYTVRTTLFAGPRAIDVSTTRIGFREARFAVEGFFLNGKKSHLFGLNRHELFPYTGFAMPDRIMRRDAEILRHELHCDTVRCSHYPQTEAFLDACDELGLMVWEEIPGWQYIGDDAWKQLAIRNTQSMVLRDRNHPSIVIWGTRINESHNDVPLYEKTNAVARALDDSRPLSGSMTNTSKQGWIQDVFAFDDYHARPDGSVQMARAVEGVPFMFAEAVGQYSYGPGGKGFHNFYRRAGDPAIFAAQALYHAQGQDRGIDDPRCCGVIAWCAFEYASPMNQVRGIKCPGVVDVFRIPKLGAAFYRSQVAPSVRPVIEPSFYWDSSAAWEQVPGGVAWIFSNCDELTVTVGKAAPMRLKPQRAAFPNLAYAPFSVDLPAPGADHPELRIEGFVAGKLALTRRFSSDRSRDELALHADDKRIKADGMDTTRIWFQTVDAFGSPVSCLEGAARIAMNGPATMIGDEAINFADSGGVGAIWVRSRAGEEGSVTVTVDHPRFNTQSITIDTIRG